jgi:CHAD domain-containing protein
MKQQVRHFQLPADFDITSIEIGYQKDKITKRAGICRYYDTFDRRIRDRSWELIQIKDEIILRDMRTYQTHGRTILEVVPAFACDFPPGILKEKLQEIIDVRALLLIAEALYSQYQTWFRNEKHKAILQFVREKFDIKQRKETCTIGTVIGIKGYGQSFEQLNKWMKGKKYKSITYPAYALIAEQKESYSSKIRFHFNLRISSITAVKKIFNVLTAKMEVNEAGIINDIDTEFLHDFRVSVRRIRSAINQFKLILEPEMVQWAKTAFSKLGSRTNQLRDLDVYLLKEMYYKSLLPMEYQSLIEPFFNNLKSQRKHVFRMVVEYLKSSEYQAIKTRWKAYMQSLDNSQKATTLYIDADRWIHKRLQRVVKFCKQLDKRSSDNKLHRLRIACKKLRYLLEFFSSLYPKKQVKSLINELKGLQDHLGLFNDYGVQKEKLRAFNEQSSGETQRVVRLLIHRLADAQETERYHCFTAIRKFIKLDFSPLLSKRVEE